MDKEQFFDVFSHAKVYDLEQPRYFGAPVLPALELFVCLPLKMQGATGSPIRPIAVVPQQ